MPPPQIAFVGARSQDSGTWVHPNGTTKQVVATKLAAAFGGFCWALCEIDCSALTKNANICAIESSTDGGSTWASTPGLSFTANVSQHFKFWFPTTNSFRVVLTSGANEGATRNIPWKVTLF